MGEVATDDVAARMIQMGQVASLFTLFSHHAKTTPDLVMALRNYFTRQNFEKARKGVHFGSMYFCKDFLPEKLVFRELCKYEKPLR